MARYSPQCSTSPSRCRMTMRNFPPTLGSSAVTSAPSPVPIQRARLTGSSQAANTRSRGTGSTRRITRTSAESCVELMAGVLGCQPAALPARRAAPPRTRGNARASGSPPAAARAGDGASARARGRGGVPARLALLEAEKELTRRSEELARRRQELPWVRIDKEYRFETDEGSASLADLLRGRSQLLVYHFMFGPDYKAGCPSCSAIADGFNGFVIHLANHDVMLWAASRAPLAKLQAYKRRMGWTFPWVSS